MNIKTNLRSKLLQLVVLLFTASFDVTKTNK